MVAKQVTEADVTVGTGIRFQHPTSNGGTVQFIARVIATTKSHVTIEIPEKAQRMPFPPAGGRPYGRMAIATLTHAMLVNPKS